MLMIVIHHISFQMNEFRNFRSFYTCFFHTEIPNRSEGEIFINYKRGGVIAIAKEEDKENNVTNGKIESISKKFVFKNNEIIVFNKIKNYFVYCLGLI